MRLIDADALLSKTIYNPQHAPYITKNDIESAPTYGWISVEDRLPENGETVLAVKQLKDGRRNICLAYCIREHEHFDVETETKVKSPYWVCGGNNKIIYWMPLPGLPEEG